MLQFATSKFYGGDSRAVQGFSLVEGVDRVSGSFIGLFNHLLHPRLTRLLRRLRLYHHPPPPPHPLGGVVIIIVKAGLGLGLGLGLLHNQLRNRRHGLQPDHCHGVPRRRPPSYRRAHAIEQRGGEQTAVWFTLENVTLPQTVIDDMSLGMLLMSGLS
ncbi:hypothetical protein TIFTF001_013397 [Ficus carica]|uniref:Uncharacterized protein n=1 Tax=Ficus carica TaxID=3494 RepID=A0AA88D4K1_FICCA|nr:hypothetical protein TIFTF001_013397 [Ficus carica]